MPSTLQAVIAARIDRLDPAAKRTLNAAAVIGSQFTPDMLQALGGRVRPGRLGRRRAHRSDSVQPEPEFAFRHPLVRAVAYESQLKSDRAQLHRRVAAAVEQTDQNAALIAEHMEAAGELRAAYDWHMRAGVGRSTVITPPRISAGSGRSRWPTPCPPTNGDVLPMRIAPRSLLCSNCLSPIPRRDGPLRRATRALHRGRRQAVSGDRHGGAGDGARHSGAPARGFAAGVGEHGARRVDGDPELTVALTFTSCVAKFQVAELDDVLAMVAGRDRCRRRRDRRARASFSGRRWRWPGDARSVQCEHGSARLA